MSEYNADHTRTAQTLLSHLADLIAQAALYETTPIPHSLLAEIEATLDSLKQINEKFSQSDAQPLPNIAIGNIVGGSLIQTTVSPHHTRTPSTSQKMAAILRGRRSRRDK